MGRTGSGRVDLQPLHATFGARLTGLDPCADADDLVWDDLRAAFARYRLLVLALPGLTDDEQLRVAGHLGPIAAEGLAEPRAVGFVSNVHPDASLGGIGASWHIDYGFFPNPYEAISLYALELPVTGTQTWFADAVTAATELPPVLRARVEGRSARHAVDVAAPEAEAVVRVRAGRLDDTFPHAVRPVLWPHHASGAPILGVWEQQTDAIVELPEAESTALLEELFAHLYRPEHVYTHDWALGDLVVWDNHAVQHSRPEIGVEQARTLRRVCVGERQDVSIFLHGYRRGGHDARGAHEGDDP